MRSGAQGTPKRANSCLACASSSEPDGKSSTATLAGASTPLRPAPAKRPALSMAPKAAVQLSAAAKAGTPRCGQQRTDLRAHAG